ncbi:hypothetical protein B7463_g9831, partial [Scytalidium lignicola]
MSKITSKNLHYDTTLPPFLARLQANQGASDGRHEFTVARPKKPRNAEEDAEDEPVVFDEVSGESLTRKEWEERAQEETKSKDKDEDEKDGGGGQELSREEGNERVKEKIAEIGVAKKRKAGKVIGGDDEDESDEAKVISKKTDGKKIERASASADRSATKSEGKKLEKGGKASKKGKKIKLSFGDDE